MKLVYVAGPYRASDSWEVEHNVRDAENVGFMIAQFGAVPVIPHTMYRFWNGTLTDEFWLEATLDIMRRCDAVVMACDWEFSSGAKAEKQEAERLKIPVFLSTAEGNFEPFQKWLAQSDPKQGVINAMSRFYESQK